jgi:CRP/FNR family cyclic AMP-dependent transcriptional regulator
MKLDELLAHVSLFERLDGRAVKSLAKLLKTQEYPAGHCIVAEGQLGLGLYIVVEGRCDVLRGGRLLQTLGPGDFFGETALLDDLPRTADVKTTTPTTCATLAKWEFLGELESHPEMALPLLPMLSRRLRVAEARADRLAEELNTTA